MPTPSRSEPPGSTHAERAQRIERVLAEVAARRLTGQHVPDSSVLAANPDLLPHLAEALRELGLIEAARARGCGANAPARAGGSSEKAGLAGAVAPRTPLFAPDLLPGYELLEELQRGGQGVVYRAIQRSTRRAVAVKVLRGGPFGGPHERARFEREVRILAQLRHPHLVTIHDSGTTAGCAYFVMDYIAGRPLDAWLAERERPIAAILRLFRTIAEAVHAAQLRGVIHRDLKPGNICIDRDDQPHVLDFGLAKMAPPPAGPANGQAQHAAGAAEPAIVSAGPDMTQTGQFLGSLPWASPEQAEGREVDLRTDVYSLGVMLYPALTGEFPYPVTGPPRTVLNNIVTLTPRRPSAVRRQGGRPGRLDDELDTIVLKCLAKDPEQRYQSAGELGRDLDRYLAGEPIEAKRASPGYVLRKLLWRYRLAAAAAGVLLLAAVALAVTMSLLYRRALVAEASATGRQQEAQRQAAKAQRIQEFLRNMLASADPGEARGREVSVRELLDRAARELPGELAGRPQIEAAVRTTLGETYHALGRDAAAEAQLAAAVALYQHNPPDDPLERLKAQNSLADVLRARGQLAAAEDLFRRTIAELDQTVGPGHPESLTVRNNLAILLLAGDQAAEAETLARDVLAVRRSQLGPDHAETLQSLNTLAVVLQARGEPAQATELLTELVAMRRRVLGEEHVATLTSMNNLAALLRAQQRLDEAEPLFRRTLELQQKILGPEHADTLRTMNNLAYLLDNQARDAEAEELFRQTLALRRRVLGDVHPQTLNSMESLAGLLYRQQRWEETEALCRETALGREQALGPAHTDTLNALFNLGMVYRKQGRPAEAEPWLRRAYEYAEQARGPDDPTVLPYLEGLAACLWAAENAEAAEPLLRTSVQRRLALVPDDTRGQAAAYRRLAECLARLGRTEEAAEAEQAAAGLVPAAPASGPAP